MRWLAGVLDLARNQILNAVFHNSSTDPASAVEGQVYRNTASHVTKIRGPSSWETVSVDSLQWMGEYDEDTDYVPLNLVSYSGGAYICEVACTGVLPTEVVYWSTFAAATGVLEAIDGGVWTA
jgi:hypothetical protein